MKVNIPRGKYILAVSGGVDSVVLLHLLAKQVTGDRLRVTAKETKSHNPQSATSNLELVVAHFDHGIRPDASDDEKLVRKLAQQYNLPLEVGYGHLEPGTSEDQARQARYHFLEAARQKNRAKAIITAHHQDDWLETALINLIRGTGWRGLVAIAANPKILRPLLDTSKKDILQYASRQGLKWREDPTNINTNYLRNYIRHKILPKMTVRQRSMLIKNIDKVAKNSKELNSLIATISHSIIHNNRVNRLLFSELANEMAREVLVDYFRSNNVSLSQPTISKLAIQLKTAKPGTRLQLGQGVKAYIDRDVAELALTD